MLYTIGEMAKLLDVPASTLRFYDKEGLLPFVERSSGGMRMFKDSDYGFLQIIGCLKKSSMSLKDIRQFIYMVMQGDETIEARLQLFAKRKEEGTISVIKNMNLEDIPKEYQLQEKCLKIYNLTFSFI